MGNAMELSEATQRLDTALKAMEDAVAGKRRKHLTAESLEEQLQSLETSLAAERARGENIAAATEDVSERIDAIMGSIRVMLQND